MAKARRTLAQKRVWQAKETIRRSEVVLLRLKTKIEKFTEEIGKEPIMTRDYGSIEYPVVMVNILESVIKESKAVIRQKGKKTN